MENFVNLWVNSQSYDSRVGSQRVVSHVAKIAVVSQHDTTLFRCQHQYFVIRCVLQAQVAGADRIKAETAKELSRSLTEILVE